MNRPKVFNQYNHTQRTSVRNSLGGGISMTVPDQSMTLKQILTRFAHGHVPTGREGFYLEEEDIPYNNGIDVRKLDLSEIADLKNSNIEYIQRFKNELAEKNKQLLADKEKQRLEEYYNKRKQEEREKNPSQEEREKNPS